MKIGQTLSFQFFPPGLKLKTQKFCLENKFTWGEEEKLNSLKVYKKSQKNSFYFFFFFLKSQYVTLMKKKTHDLHLFHSPFVDSDIFLFYDKQTKKKKPCLQQTSVIEKKNSLKWKQFPPFFYLFFNYHGVPVWDLFLKFTNPYFAGNFFSSFTPHSHPVSHKIIFWVFLQNCFFYFTRRVTLQKFGCLHFSCWQKKKCSSANLGEAEHHHKFMNIELWSYFLKNTFNI